MEENKTIEVENEEIKISTSPIEEESEKKSGLKGWISRHKKGLKLGALAIASAVAGAIIHSKLAYHDDDSDEEDPDQIPENWREVDLGNDEVAVFTTKEELNKVKNDEEA